MELMELEKEVGLDNSSWAKSLVGQDRLWSKIQQILIQERYPHCSLLLGKAGNGQLVLALSIAQKLLCKDPSSESCACDSCNKVKQLIHPDILFSFPMAGGNDQCDDFAEEWRKACVEMPYMNLQDWIERLDKSGKNANINVKEIRQLIDKIFLKPYESKNKVAIIWMPEYLGKEGNRLLKILEEPPENTYIIMVGEQSELILPTILSRAQMFRLQTIDIETLSVFLQQNYLLTEEQAFTLASFSDGNVQKAIQTIHESEQVGLNLIKTLFQKSYQYDAIGIVDWVEQFAALNKDDQKNAILLLQQILIFALRNKYEVKFNENTNAVIEYANKISASLSSELIEHICDWTDEVYFAINRYAHVKLCMHNFCIKLAKALRKK